MAPYTLNMSAVRVVSIICITSKFITVITHTHTFHKQCAGMFVTYVPTNICAPRPIVLLPVIFCNEDGFLEILITSDFFHNIFQCAIFQLFARVLSERKGQVRHQNKINNTLYGFCNISWQNQVLSTPI